MAKAPRLEEGEVIGTLLTDSRLHPANSPLKTGSGETWLRDIDISVGGKRSFGTNDRFSPVGLLGGDLLSELNPGPRVLSTSSLGGPPWPETEGGEEGSFKNMTTTSRRPFNKISIHH